MSAQVCDNNINLSSCGVQFPSYFCCPRASTCLSINTSASSGFSAVVLCCPSGSDCSLLAPIPCDVDAALAGADNQIHVALNNSVGTFEFPQCGGARCCPVGYACTEAGKCERRLQVSVVLGTATGTPTATASGISSTESAPATIGVNSTISSPSSIATAASSSARSATDTKTITLVSVICVLAILIVAITAAYFVRRRRLRKREVPRRSGVWEKAELDGTQRGDRSGLVEMDAAGSLVELPASSSWRKTVHELMGKPVVGELPAGRTST